MKRKLAIGCGGLVFFSMCTCLFSYWFFPWSRVRDIAVQEVERPMGPNGERRPSGIELEIGELSPSWFTGATLTDVEVRKLSDNPDDEPMEIRIDEVTARLGVFAAISGEVDVSFSAEVGGGELSGVYQDGETETVVQMELDRVNLARLGVLESAVGLPVEGRIGGEVDLTIAAEPQDTTGRIDLGIDGLVVGDGEAKLQIEALGGSGVTVEQINAGTVTLVAEVDSGVARIDTFEANGDDLELGGSGSIRLMRPVQNSRMDLLLRFEFSDGYRDRNDRTRALFSLLDFNPWMQRARTPDGALQYQLRGAFGGQLRGTPAGRVRPRR
ncbi:MAG: type II secretion system protein GspN [Myxococcota bacterium]